MLEYTQIYSVNVCLTLIGRPIRSTERTRWTSGPPHRQPSKKLCTIGIMACITERNGHGMAIGSRLGYKKASQELKPHTRSGSSKLSCSLIFLPPALLCL